MMKKIFQFKRMYILCLIPLSIILVALARLDNSWIEAFFVPFIYKPLSFTVGGFVSLFPFSVTEFAVIILVFLSIWYIARVIIRIVKQKSAWKHHLYKMFINILCVGAVALFGFEICMGLNYYRAEAKDYLDLEIKKSTTQELYDLCVMLVYDLNETRAECNVDDSGIVKLSDKNRYQTSDSAREAYKKMTMDFPMLKGCDIKNKPLVSSKFFSMCLTTGIYIPYTFESNINVDVPEYTIPATMCHELTHSRGFMREDEANFFGYLACTYSDRADFKYSGAYLAFDYVFSELYDDDKTLAKKIAKMLDDGVIDDITNESEYWDKYFGTAVAETTDKVYNSYLEANGEESGTKSYGEMVDLLLAYYRKTAK